MNAADVLLAFREYASGLDRRTETMGMDYELDDYDFGYKDGLSEASQGIHDLVQKLVD